MTKLIKAKYHSDLQVAEFIAEDGRHLIRAGGTLPWRIFNIGDLVSPVSASGEPAPKKTQNYIGFAHGKDSGNYFFIFPDYETGRAELKKSLQRKYKDKTIRETIEKYAPPSQNNTEKYISDVCKLTGVKETTKTGDLSEDKLEKLIDAIERIEGYHNESETRVEKWVNVSHIQATNGVRPLAEHEIVVKTDTTEKTIKSNQVGLYPPIVHGKTKTEILEHDDQGQLKSIATLPNDQGQHYSLINQFTQYFGMTAPVKAEQATQVAKHPMHYTVQPGDNLSKIAKRFNVPMAQLKADNHLVTDKIMPGQVLGIHISGPTQIAPDKPKKSVKKRKQEKTKRINASDDSKTHQTRSKEGEGQPLALITPEEGVAPWMKYAIAEAKRWKGAKEGEIEKGINYHKEVKDGQKSMTSAAWCAAFANWCLMQAGYPIDKGEHIARAKAFHMHNDSKTQNPMYVELETPIYGAIGVLNHGNGKYHVGFVYGLESENKVILLGGNQGDRLKFSVFQINVTKEKNESTRFFVPISYVEQAKKDAKKNTLEPLDVDQLNLSIGIPIQVKNKKHTTQSDEKTT